MQVAPVNEFARYARDLLRAAAGLDEAADRVTERVGRGALGTARDIAPVLSGELRGDLRMRRDGDRAIVEVSTYYARFQEFGTSRMAPNPFMRPAVDRWEPELVREVERVCDRMIEDIS